MQTKKGGAAMVPYASIRYGMFLCYLFLLVVFSLTKGNRKSGAIRFVLLDFIVWGICEFAVIFSVKPGYIFWIGCAMLAAGLLLCALFYFLSDVLHVDIRRHIGMLGIFSATAILVNGVYPWMIGFSEMNGQLLGQKLEIQPGFFVYIFLQSVISIFIFRAFFQNNKQAGRILKQCWPILSGSALVFIGIICSTFTSNYFPFVSVAGIFFMLCIMYVVYHYNLVVVNLQTLYITIYGLVLLFGISGLINMERLYLRLERGTGFSREICMMIVCTASITWALFLLLLAHITLSHFRYLWQDRKKQVLEQFQENVAATLEKEEIYDYAMQAAYDLFPAIALRIRMRQPQRDRFQVVRDSSRGRQEEEEMTDYDTVLSKIEPISKSHDDAISKTWDPEAMVHIGEIPGDKEVAGYMDLCMKKGVIFQREDQDVFKQLCFTMGNALKNAGLYEKVYEESITDSMTGLYNRMYANRVIVEQFDPKKQASVIYLEIDDLRLYNELYGTDAGDRLILWMAHLIKGMVGNAKAFRYGANEFLLHLPDTTYEAAYDIAEAIRAAVEKQSLDGEEEMHAVTISAGVAEYPHHAKKLEKLIGYAQRGGFYSKKNGKNKVTVYSRELSKHSVSNHSYEQIIPTIYALTAAINAKDNYTFQHSQKVSEYAAIMGETLGLPPEEVDTLKQAGMLHDIGKIGVPEAILKKKGRLTDEEYEIMKGHVKNSIKMIYYLPDMNYVIPAVVAHHERYDGKGYPEGLKGDDIPYLGRILTLADCFDAMTAIRPYKPALSSDYAVSEIEKNKGTQFDPELADVFIRLVKESKIVPDSEKEQVHQDNAG